ncbi:MAG: chitobiase/beta-hexosaminidase C-terminal domain-containing protein [Candidatus Cloacimonetes bacterium]|nr:chitobiase/beta-hexosaminidase C-terminal domain-containing protein [Candidatus Cloacimonadota bacterium]
MKSYRFIILFSIFLLLFGSLSTAERSPEWYEEQGLLPESINGEIPSRVERSLREIPEGGLLLIPDSTPDRVMAFDPQTGDLIDANFIPAYPDYLSTPIHIVMNAEETSFLMTDQVRDLVQQFSFDGLYEGIFAPAGGVNNAILDNIRGMFVKDNGNYLVTVASGANANGIAEFDSQGQYLGNFIANDAGGLNGPWSIIFRPDFNDYLISASSSNAIHRYDADGQPLGTFVASISFPEQMQLLPNGNILVATFSNPSGVYEFNSQGTQVGFYNPITGLRGVYELPNGNILVTNGSGVYEINRQGVLVDTKIIDVSGRFITFVSSGAGYEIPFEEDFETGSLPEDWMEEYTIGNTDWAFQDGGSTGNPPSAYEGLFNAFFHSETLGQSTVLMTPPILIQNAVNPILRFQHAQAAWNTAQDELHVYYKIGENGDWFLLESYDENVPAWTERMISLPEQNSDYYIGFEAVSGGGHGVCIDLVEIFDYLFPIIEVTPTELNIILVEGENTTESILISNTGTANLEYEIALSQPAAWLTVADPTGIVPPDDEVEIQLLIETSGLTGGENYSVTLIITDDNFGLETEVTVNLQVEEMIFSPPLNLSAEVGMFYIELFWDAPAPGNRNLLGYNIYRQDSPQAEFEQINSQLVTEEGYLDGDLEPGLYSYYIIALYTLGASDPSEILEVILPEQVALPTITPDPGVYENEVVLELFCDTEDALIYYTLDGEDPDEDSYLYDEPFTLDESAIVKARAYKDGYFPSDIVEAEFTIESSAADGSDIPTPFTKLNAAYPNPFNPNTTISFSLAETGKVIIEIYNTRGQKVRTLVEKNTEAGNYLVIWDGRNDEGRNLNSGIYFCRMIVNDYSSIRKMVLLQ